MTQRCLAILLLLTFVVSGPLAAAVQQEISKNSGHLEQASSHGPDCHESAATTDISTSGALLCCDGICMCAMGTALTGYQGSVAVEYTRQAYTHPRREIALSAALKRLKPPPKI